ncbi:MAG TPA: rod shape-determining protein MreC [Ignavibacteriaceae bacterium]|nr:rod shape-determining protein MreC [Ignavibacteriaceae bacterium]
MVRFFLRIWENFKEYIILVILLITSLFTISFNKSPAVRNVRATAFGSFAVVTSLVSDLTSIAKIKSENRRLREINAELMMQVNRLREFGIQNAELKNLLVLKDSSGYPLIPASVVSKSISASQSTITLNAGKNEGVRPGMPVINDLGLIGIVFNTSDDFSIVRTLKNIDVKIAVKDERTRIDGIMKWNGDELVIINVPKTYDVQPGDRIITSEISSIIPVPLPVGIATGITKVSTGIFNEVRVRPFVDFNRVEHVFILKLVESVEKNNLELNFYNRK